MVTLIAGCFVNTNSFVQSQFLKLPYKQSNFSIKDADNNRKQGEYLYNRRFRHTSFHSQILFSFISLRDFLSISWKTHFHNFCHCFNPRQNFYSFIQFTILFCFFFLILVLFFSLLPIFILSLPTLLLFSSSFNLLPLSLSLALSLHHLKLLQSLLWSILCQPHR